MPVINFLPDGVLLEIFDLYQMDEVATSSPLPWKWGRLAHVCRTWRDIIFASSCRLNLKLLYTHGTPVGKNLGHLPALPIVVYFPYFGGSDKDILKALEHPDRVHVLDVLYSGSLAVATETQKSFPALTYLRLRLRGPTMPVLPDAFLGGCAPRLQKIYLDGIPFPAAPTLLLSARDLVDVKLRDIPSTGYISPEAMVAGLAALSRLKYLALGFRWGSSYPDRIRQPPITRAVLPALASFDFDGLFMYLEDFVAQIDAPQLSRFGIECLDEDEDTDFQIPQLCKFFDRSEKLKLSLFRRTNLDIEPYTIVIELDGGPSSFKLSIPGEGISQVLNQISAMLFNVDHLFISPMYAEYDKLTYEIRWLELLRPFTAVKVLSVLDDLSYYVALAFRRVIGEEAAEVLPALELLFLENEPVTSVMEFVAARQNTGRPLTFINMGNEFPERFELDNGGSVNVPHRFPTLL